MLIDLCWSILSESILAFVCFFYWVFMCFYIYILYICLHVYFLLAYHILFLLAHHASGLYYGSPWGPHIFLLCFAGGGLCEVKGPLPRPVTHRISVDAHVDSRGPCYDRVQHGVPQLGEVLSWNTVSG